MAANPQYPAFVTGGEVAFSTINTGRDGTGTLATVYTARAAGSAVGGMGAMCLWLAIRATGNTTAGMVRVYRHNGTTAFLLAEIDVSVVTPSGTTKAWSFLNASALSTVVDAFGRIPFNVALDPGDSIRVSTQLGEAFIATLDVGEY